MNKPIRVAQKSVTEIGNDMAKNISDESPKSLKPVTYFFVSINTSKSTENSSPLKTKKTIGMG